MPARAEIDGLPNVTQVVIGDARQRARPAASRVMLLEANVDDATGETLAHTIAALLDSRRPRRVDHADRDEEGTPRLHRERPR